MPRVDLDLESLREEIVLPQERESPRVRISVPLKGEIGVSWIDCFYRMQWTAFDDAGYHVSKNCREVYFDRVGGPEDGQWLSRTLGDLKSFIALVNGSLKTGEIRCEF